ncbi:hypothetical protein XBKB1_3000065 [Xenorhabdus bovienii str. kraussei Becker Underwood]|uniref:Uncharacterized protein n=1 Tax=Xenorhabdus bovienii str. kraussei Becker Underwood TaxID=1398204 RepID=A0A077PVM0_XENBV|nr:hypothetical protein XBKB1_3000065 [Xenorhabdus bovienii str. kraussei Becker Underwood]
MNSPCTVGVIAKDAGYFVVTKAEFGDCRTFGFVVGDEGAIGVDYDDGGTQSDKPVVITPAVLP